MVGRRLLIYIVSLAVVVGAFLWIKTQFFSSPMTTGGKRLKPVSIPSGTGGSNLEIVSRSKSGRLVYVMRFRRAIPKGQGRYHLVKPRMKFYSEHDNAILVTSDYGDVSVDQLGGPLSNHLYPRKGRLYGHVRVTVGPVASFVQGAVHRRKGQFRITLSRSIHFNYQQGLLTSRGNVLVRGDTVAFSGRRLTCELNVATKRLDYLQIAHGDYLTIKDINETSANSTSTANRSRLATPSTQRAIISPTKRVSPMTHPGNGRRQKSADASITPSTKPESTVAKPSPLSGSIYGLVFTEKVRVHVGTQRVSAHRLRLYFSSARRATGQPSPHVHSTAGSGAIAHQSTSFSKRPSKPSKLSTAAPAHSISIKRRHGAPAVKGQTLVVHWRGPLVLRPVRLRHVDLVNSQDVILQAFGRSHDPVVMHDGSTRVGYASVVRYHLATRRLRMDATGLVPIKFIDAQLGTVTCRKLLYRANSHRIRLTGPGTAVYQQVKAGKDPWHGTWQKQMLVTMLPAGKGKTRIKSLLLSGHAAFYNALFKLQARSMHATFVAGPHGGAALNQFVAHGDVHLRSLVGTSSGEPKRHDTLNANLLTLSTAAAGEGNSRRPSELYAAGSVNLIFYQAGGKSILTTSGRSKRPASSAVASLRRYHLESEYLLAHIEKASGQPPTAVQSPSAQALPGGRFTVGRFRAWRHVSLTISGEGQPINATCAILRGNRNTKLATLIGSANHQKPARIAENDNWISGQTIELNGDSQDLNIPTAGQLYLSSQPHGQKPTHLLVSWHGRMYFRNKIGEATFFSQVVAKLIGQADRKSQLSAPVIRVMLSGQKKGRPHVSEIYAFTEHHGQHVRAEDASYNRNHLIDTRLFINCHRLRYNAETQHLLVAGKGELSLENYRHLAKTVNGQAPTSRGQSAFEWGKALDYRASTNRLVLSGAVRLVYRPMRPFVLSRSIAGAYKGKNKGLILLDASKLIAQLLRSKKTTSGGVALGMGGPTKLKSVRAYHAALELSGARLTADVLSFQAQKQIAKAYSASGRDAHITTPDGKLNAAAREIIWHLSKSSQSGITLREPRASGSIP